MTGSVFASRPARPAGAAGQDAWEGWRGWEIMLAAAVLIPALFILVGRPPTVRTAIVIGLLLAILPAYLLVGRPVIAKGGTLGGVVYVSLLVGLFTPAVLIEPSTSFALFGLCPQCFMALRKGNQGVIGVVALTVPVALRFLIGGRDINAAFNLLTVATITLFFSVVFGVWMDRITVQSRERAELIGELEASRTEVARLSAERGALAERERLAGEIHDTLAQGFTSIIMLLQAAEAQPDPARHLALVMRTARENLAESRALVAALSPAPLDGSSLDEALGRITSRLGEDIGVGTEFEVTGDSHPLSPQYEVVLIRSAQEGLNNVRRHAAASHVAVSLEYARREVTLRVRDDGRGFEPGRPAGGYGLRAMRYRVEQAGGSLAVRSAPGEGTVLTVCLPEEGQ
jgi:signal transduction histidine kinase